MEVQLTAREMFEELDLEYHENYYKHEIEQILYTSTDKFTPQVVFNLGNRSYKVFYDTGKSSWTCMKLHKAINKQIEELHWNE